MPAAQEGLFGYDWRRLSLLTVSELPVCKHIGHEHFCESIFFIKHKTSQSHGSVVFLYLPLDIINDNCEFNFFYNMTPKTAIPDAGDTFLLSSLGKPSYLHCSEHSSVPIPIPAYDCTFINRSLLCDC